MGMDSLSLRTARLHVHNYTGESDDLIQRHAEGIDCRDCEDFLQLGIDAFKWLGRADHVIRSAVYRGLAEYDPSLDVALAALYAEWLKPCTLAEGWIAQQEARGFRVDNLAEFRACCEEVRAIVEAHEGTLENDALVELRDDAIDAHRKGETLELWESDQPQDA
jgi:hypothetical protein